MVEVDRQQNIEVVTFAEVENVEGKAGDFRVTLVKRPRYITEDLCTGCRTCVKYCPKESPDLFNQEIGAGKAVHVYFSQAIPLVAYIDDNCLNLKEGKCDICENVCERNAIDFRQSEEKIEVNVGTIVLSTGMAPFDPATVDGYGCGTMENVVTSMDFERLLSATGPYQGHILRGSDKEHPKKIAWVQCVGSRRVTPGENSYCSGVCCTYTQKQVILTKEHHADAECTIFHNDIRAFGKDFERYYDRTQKLPGVRFVRSYVSIERELPESKNVVVRYATPDDGVKEEEFDMVVLSVGLNPPDDNQRLTQTFGIELNSHGFAKTRRENPMETTVPGIFVSGGLQGPIDIPESVYSASGAGSQSGEYLHHRRGKVDSHVGGLVRGENDRLGALDAAFSNLLFVHVERAHTALAHTTAVIGEVEFNRCLAGLELFLGSDGEALQTEEVVVVGRDAIVDVQPPAAETTALHDDGTVSTALRHLDLGDDGLGLVLDVQKDIFGHAGHALGER